RRLPMAELSPCCTIARGGIDLRTRARTMGRLWPGVRFPRRRPSRAPAPTAVAIFTLAFGIGANTAVFSLVNTVLIRPLPYVEPQRLVMLFETRHGMDQGNVSPHEFLAWSRESRSFDRMAMFTYS